MTTKELGKKVIDYIKYLLAGREYGVRQNAKVEARRPIEEQIRKERGLPPKQGFLDEVIEYLKR